MVIKKLLTHPMLILCLMTGWHKATAQQAANPNNILATLNPNHPRLMVNGFAAFKAINENAKTDTFLSLSVANLLRCADSLLKVPECTYAFLDGYRMDTRDVYYRCYCLCTAYRLTNNKIYADRLWKDLDAASKFPDWNTPLFLDVATMTNAFAVSYDWLYDQWTDKQREQLKSQIIGKGLLQGYRYYHKLIEPGVFDWTKIEHNWNLVCNSGMALGALAIADKEPVLASGILDEVLKEVPNAIKHFGPDGAWNEGPGYWSYAMRFTVPMITSFETALGTDFGLKSIPGFSKAGGFFVGLGGANNVSFNYADAKPVLTRAPELFWLADKFNQPELAGLQKQYSLGLLPNAGPQQQPIELLYYSKAGPATPTSFSMHNYFRDAEVATLRSNWNDTAWFVGFKAGTNGVNHGHLDIGSFVLDDQGIRWIMDLGFENYNVPGYFSEVNTGGKRWTYYRTRAEGHNTLVIDPTNSTVEDQDISAQTAFTRFVSSPAKAFGIMDISAAYHGRADSVKRGVALIDRNRVLVQDEITTKANSEIYWFAHTPAKVVLSKNGKSATMQLNGKRLVAEIISPTNAVFEVVDAVPLASSPHPIENNKNEGIMKLSVHLTAKKQPTTIAIQFKEETNKSKTVVIPLAEWK